MALEWLQDCNLANKDAKYLRQWQIEIAAAEADFNSEAATLDTHASNLNASSKTTATVELPAVGGGGVTLTWLGLASHVGAGADLTGNRAHKLVAHVWTEGRNALLTSNMDWDTYVLSISLATDPNGTATTTADALAIHLNTFHGFYYSATNTGTNVMQVAAPVNFSGAVDASFTTIKEQLNQLYTGTGKTWQTVLSDNFGATVATAGTNVVSEASRLVVLLSGKTFEQSGTNLSVLRVLWTLLDSDTTTLLSLLPGTAGSPIVIWTATTTVTNTATACAGGQTTTTTTTTKIGNPNTAPSSTAGYTPTIWWLDSIDSSLVNLNTLSKCGLDTLQIQTALDDTNDNVHVVEDRTLVDLLNLSATDVTELMGLVNVDGIVSISYATALDSLADQAPGLANGYLSPALNWPMDQLIENMSPSHAMATEIAAINVSTCLDPLVKSGLMSLIATVDSAVGSVYRMVTSLVTKARSIVNDLGGIVSNIIRIISDPDGASCILGLSLPLRSANVNTLLLEIELSMPTINAISLSLNAMIGHITPLLCKLQVAIQDLLGKTLGSLVTCIGTGITNALINQFGVNLGLQICISSPLDVVTTLQRLLTRVNAVNTLIVRLLADIRVIVQQYNSFANIASQTNATDATVSCQSTNLGGLVGSLKFNLGI